MTIIRSFKLTGLSLILLSLFSCAKTKFDVQNTRGPSSNQGEESWVNDLRNEAAQKGQTLDFPPGLDYEETEKLWHLAEGSEIYPTAWMMNLESVKSIHKKSAFLDKLDEKFGIIKDYNKAQENSPFDWVGLTAGWSDEDVDKQDIFLLDGQKFSDLPLVRTLKDGSKSIAMSGVNCTFCHTGEVKFRDDSGKIQKKVVEGAPSIIDVRGFFKDLYGSTVATMLDKKKLDIFLHKMGVKNSKEVATQFSKRFKSELGVKSSLVTVLVKVLSHGPVLGKYLRNKKEKKVAQLLFDNRAVISRNFQELIKISYGLDKVPSILAKRMDYLSVLGGQDPALEETPGGYGRTDAFGRISNSVARGDNPIPLTGMVSLPYMYQIKYKAMFHYNGNTNSVIARNIGQSFGLGAVLRTPEERGLAQFDSTSNLHNLIKMEKLLYKIPVPRYQSYFGENSIDKQKALRGCNTYIHKCMGCHEAKPDRVGPVDALVDYKVHSLKEIGTDETYIWNQATPINGKAFREVIFGFTDKVKEAYFEKYGVGSDTVTKWANQDLRGKEIFRDTILGDDRFVGDSDMGYVAIKKGKGYVAKNLSGIWATAPYLHNGSVPNIFELLLPSSKRSKSFILGSKHYDFKNMGFVTSYEDNKPWARLNKIRSYRAACKPNTGLCFDVTRTGDSNKGHEPSMYGGELTHTKKYELIEFLKVLTPESEYSWKHKPMYKIVNNKCELRK
jgi:hypothetical protein